MIAGLEEVSFHDPWPREMLAYELCHPHSVLLVAAGEAELLRVGVAPGFRRRGFARALLVEGLERLRDAEVQVCFLEVRVDNQSAIYLYESLGFSCTGLRRGYYRDGADALIFVLGL